MSAPEPTFWFPRRRYGWGLPCCGQGWVVYAADAGLMALAAVHLRQAGHEPAWSGCALGLTLALTAICWWKGEPPGWRWGGGDAAN